MRLAGVPLFGALFCLVHHLGVYLFCYPRKLTTPLMMAGVRFLSAGMLLMAFLLLRGENFRRCARPSTPR